MGGILGSHPLARIWLRLALFLITSHADLVVKSPLEDNFQIGYVGTNPGRELGTT